VRQLSHKPGREGTMPAQNDKRLKLTIYVLLIVYILNFLDRQIVGILAQPISKELHLSDTEIGLMTGLAFAIFYTGLGIPIARYADRHSADRVTVVTACLAVWSLMTAICGAALTFGQLFAARVGVGIGEAGGTPPVHALIAEMAPPEQRASALSLYQLGPPLGGLIGMVMGGYLADSIGWRWAFVVVGAPGIVLALLVRMILRDPRRDGTAPVARAKPIGIGEAFGHILVSRANRLILIGVAFSAIANFGMLIWGPIYLQRSFGISAHVTGLWFGLANGLGSAIGVWYGGQLGDRLLKRGKQHLMTGPAVCIGLACPLLVAGLLSPSWPLAIGLFFPAIGLLWLHVGPAYSAVQGLVPSSCRATASATILLMQNLFGLGLGSPLIGKMSDHFKPDYGVDSVRMVLAVLVGLVTLAAAALFWASRKYLPGELDRFDATAHDEVLKAAPASA
jgi:MFS transporter, Spinster family, sphingosine-1-phosphate transporter